MMKLALGLLLAVIGYFAAGCSSETRNDLKEVGRDIGSDINEAARDADRAVKDVVD